MRSAVLLFVLLIASLPIRLINIQSPAIERHDFRQTQTAYSAKEFIKDGFRIDYRTPTLGPPWMYPMEFPVYQAVASWVFRLGFENVDLACRVTTLAFFYLSGIVLYVITARYLDGPIPLLVIAFYVFCPYSICWSRSVMIDYCSVFFALLFFELVTRFTRTQNWLLIPFAILVGALASLSKVTTLGMLLLALPIAVLFEVSASQKKTDAIETGDSQKTELGTSALWHHLLLGFKMLFTQRPVVLASLLFIAAIPFYIVVQWVHHSDAIKAASPYTSSLTSSALKAWNYGTLTQRFTPQAWFVPIVTPIAWILPLAFTATVPVSVIAAWNANAKERMLVTAAVLGIATPVLIFFNLYVRHDYYQIALTPMYSILGGYGLFHLWRWCSQRGAAPRRILVAALLGSYSIGAWQLLYHSKVLRDHKNHPDIQLARRIAEITSPEERVVVVDKTWSPKLLYYSDRYGLTLKNISPRDEMFFTQHEFTVLVRRMDWDGGELSEDWNTTQLFTQNGYSVSRMSPSPALIEQLSSKSTSPDRKVN